MPLDTEYIDRLFLELSQFAQAVTKTELELFNILLNFQASGRPHGRNVACPDGCECELCECWDKANKYINNYDKDKMAMILQATK